MMTMITRISLATLLLLCLPWVFFAQRDPRDYYTRNFNLADGLTSDAVFGITQDKFGFLWIMTWDGLSRFDGFTFRNYLHDPNDTASLPYFMLHAMCVDSENTLWVLGEGNLSRYDRSADNFPGASFPACSEPNPRYLVSLTTDKSGILHVIATDGIFRYNRSSSRFERLSLPSGHGISLACKGNNILFDENNGLWIYDADHQRLIQAMMNSGDNSDRSIRIIRSFPFIRPMPDIGNFIEQMEIRTLKNGYFIVTGNIGLYLIDPLKNKTIPLNSPSPALLRDTRGDLLWSEVDHGLYHYSEKTGLLVHYPLKETGRVITHILDRNGCIWYGSESLNRHGTGLTQLFQRKNPWQNLTGLSDNELKNLAVYALCEDKGRNLWIGAKNDDRLLKIDDGGIIERIKVLPDGFRDPSITPRAIAEDEQGSLWVAYLEGYLFLSGQDKETFFRVYPKDESEPSGMPLHSFKILRSVTGGPVIAAGHSGIAFFDPSGHKLIKSLIIGSGDFYSLYEDDAHDLWLGNCGLLYRVGFDLSLKERITIAGARYNIEDILPADSSRLWLALLGGGLCRFDTKTGRELIYSTRNGLVNNVVYSILEDEKKNLWISTDKGISMFNPATGQFVNYNDKDGLAIREFNSDAALLRSDGSMLFGGMGGIVAFDPDSVNLSRSQESRLMITGLQYFRKGGQNYMPVYDIRDLRLEKGVKNLRIHFSEINFISQKKSSFRYRIGGLKEEWDNIETGNRFIEVNGLHPGSFTVEIAGSDLSGMWTKKASLIVEIPPFYYETWWFKLIFELIAVALVVGFIIFRLRHLSLIHRNRTTNLKLLALQEQLNPHFISNSLMAVEAFTADHDKRSMNEYITRLYSLMRRMMEYSGKEFVPVSEEVELLYDYLKAEQIRVGFEFQIIHPPFPGNLYLAPSFIQPVIENAIKHGISHRGGGTGRIIIVLEQVDTATVKCEVKDNGPGMDQGLRSVRSAGRQSKGLSIIKERLKLYSMLYKRKYGLDIMPGDPDDNNYPGVRAVIAIPGRIME